MLKTGFGFLFLFLLVNFIAASAPSEVSDSLSSTKPNLLSGLISDSINELEISPWVISNTGRLNINQISFTNWAEGGESTIASNVYYSLRTSYLKKGFKMDSFLNVAYGSTWNEEQGIRKTDDKIDLGSSLGLEAFDHWFYSFVISLKTQFNEGYKYPNDSIVVSRFFAPATFLLSMGMEYKPNAHTSIFISPSSGKFVFVNDQELADKGAFGVNPAIVDTNGLVVRQGSRYRSDFGINFIISLNRDVIEHVNVDSKLNLHNNYMDHQLANRWNFDVDWETSVNFKINSFLSSLLYIHILYDDDVPIPTYETIEGKKIQTGQGPKLQIKQNFGIGITLKV